MSPVTKQHALPITYPSVTTRTLTPYRGTQAKLASMKREDVELLLGRKVSDAEWLVACSLLDAIERHPDGEAVMDRCIERGLSVEATISELDNLLPPSS